MNELIRVPQVRVVDEEGAQMGVMPTVEALRLAQDRGYDLVEVAPMAAPPVTRLLDYGQFKYEQARRDKEARRHQRSVVKEIRLKVKIGRGDFETKVRRAIQFLEAGDRVKVTCQFRGRELSHAYLGRDLLIRFAELVGDHGALERQPLLEGKAMSIVIGSTHKLQVQPKPAGEEVAQPAAAAATQETEQAAATIATKETPEPAATAAPAQAKAAAAPPARAAAEKKTKPAPVARSKAAVGGKPAGG